MELVREDGIVLSDDRERIDMARVFDFLAQSYWANDRSQALIEQSFAHSYPYGVYAPGGVQIALTRATTDLSTFCWIGDVYVDPEWRGKGVGHWMVGAVIEHLRTFGLKRFLLATCDAPRPSTPILPWLRFAAGRNAVDGDGRPPTGASVNRLGAAA